MRPVRLRNYIFYLLALTITLPLLVLSYSQYRMIEQEIRKDDLLLVEDALALSNNIKNRVDSAKTLVVMSASTLQVYGTEDKSALRGILKSILTEVPYFLNSTTVMRMETSSFLSLLRMHGMKVMRACLTQIGIIGVTSAIGTRFIYLTSLWRPVRQTFPL